MEISIQARVSDIGNFGNPQRRELLQPGWIRTICWRGQDIFRAEEGTQICDMISEDNNTALLHGLASRKADNVIRALKISSVDIDVI